MKDQKTVVWVFCDHCRKSTIYAAQIGQYTVCEECIDWAKEKEPLTPMGYPKRWIEEE